MHCAAVTCIYTVPLVYHMVRHHLSRWQIKLLLLDFDSIRKYFLCEPNCFKDTNPL